MSKRISLIILAVILVITMVIPSTKVYAANKKVNTVEAVYESGKLTVSGSVEEGMLAVAVQVLDSDNNLVILETGSVDSNNKYNTRAVAWLTPTPIWNPALSTIEAVLFPNQTSYLFYLHGSDGQIHYAETNAQHEQNKQYL